jgi:hypothetical protein
MEEPKEIVSIIERETAFLTDNSSERSTI